MAGTADPVAYADEVLCFAEDFGLPIAIKAAFGGGGRGLKMACEMEVELLVGHPGGLTAFSRGEFLVNRFLDRPRHVEAQCWRTARQCAGRLDPRLLAAAAEPEAGRRGAGSVPVPGRREKIYASSRRSCGSRLYRCRTWNSWSDRTAPSPSSRSTPGCRLERPVSEEVTGLDLVREMFRIADGEVLGYDDPAVVEALDRVPDQRRGRRPRLHARPGHPEQLARAGRPRRTGRRGLCRAG